MSQSPPKILLSGASGMLGTALQQALAARSFPVLQLVRHAPAATRQLQWDPGANPSIAGPDNLENLTAAIHLSGSNVAAHRWTHAYKREMTVSRVQSTNSLAVALARLENPPQTLLIASAIGIYGNRGDEMMDESSTPGSGFLADLCQQWEAASQPAVEAGIRVVHLRFGVVLAPGRNSGALARLVPIFRLGLGGPLGIGRRPHHLWMSWISLTDAIAAILFLLGTPTLSGAFNLTTPNPVTNTQFTHSLARQLHRPAILPVPALALRLAFGQMANETILASIRAVPARLTAAGFQFNHPTIEQALAAALSPPVPRRPALS